MLGFKEKRQYQGIINNGLDFLATSPSFSDKRKTQKDIADALEKLGENTPAPDQNIIFLQEVIAGQHDSENVNDLAKNPDLETFTAEDLIPDGPDEADNLGKTPEQLAAEIDGKSMQVSTETEDELNAIPSWFRTEEQEERRKELFSERVDAQESKETDDLNSRIQQANEGAAFKLPLSIGRGYLRSYDEAPEQRSEVEQALMDSYQQWADKNGVDIFHESWSIVHYTKDVLDDVAKTLKITDAQRNIRNGVENGYFGSYIYDIADKWKKGLKKQRDLEIKDSVFKAGLTRGFKIGKIKSGSETYTSAFVKDYSDNSFVIEAKRGGKSYDITVNANALINMAKSADNDVFTRTGIAEKAKNANDTFFSNLKNQGNNNSPDIDNEATQEKQEELTPDGLDNEVKTAKGTKVITGFMVVEASKLIVSHDNQGNENPEYPYELQPRDRKRAESVAWVLKTAKNLDVDSLGKTRRADSGAPIVGKDRVVESGNGRTMAIIEAYRIGEAEEYRDWLIDEAKSFGLNPDKINTMKKPVLVRVRKSKLDRVAFATEANQDDKLAMTATEKAKADAHRLTPDLISKLKDGDLSSASNRDFILGFLQSLGDTEAAQYSTTDGKPTKQIFDRVQAALFAHAYNDDRLLQLMADDAKPEIKNIISALNAASPEFIKAKGINESAHSKTIAQLTDSVEVSLDQEAVDTIINATNVIMDAKNKGLSIEDLLSQEDIFGSNITPEIAAMALFIRDNNKSSARLAMAFQEMASFIKSDLQSRQTSSLFGDDEPVTLVDVLRVANDKLKQSYGDNVKTIGGENLGGFIDLFTETMGQNAAREAYLAEQAPQTETDPNVALLQDIAKGQYSHLDSEALLDKAEPAARAVDVASYSELIGEAMGEWLNVDNKAYALDSVLDTRNIIGWFEN
jgi:hypothetical protein